MSGGYAERFGGAALITGASAGIGRAFAAALARRGMDLILVARRHALLDGLKAELTGTRVVTVALDLCEPDAPRKLADAVAREGLEVGLLINNAGVGTYGSFAELPADAEARMVDLNCKVPLLLTHTFVPRMVEARRGGVVFVASLAAFQPTPYLATYGATKAFDLMLGEALWAELRPHGVDVLALCPGYVVTEFHQAAQAEAMPARGAVLPAEQVVEIGLAALGKTPSVIPGGVNKLLSAGARFAPRSLVASMARRFNAPVERR